MKQLMIAAFLVTLILGCSTVEKELTAEIIIEKAIKTYGGEKNLRSIESKSEKGVTLIFMKDSLYRTNQFLSLKKTGGKHYYQSPAHQKKYGKKLVFASNGEYSWTQNDGALAPYMQPQEEHINQGGEDYPYFFKLKERGVTAVYKETIIENNETLHRVDYIGKDGGSEEVYFVDNLWVIRKTRRFIETSQGRAEMIRYFNDFRKISDVMIPFRTEAHFPPREIDVNLIREIKINEAISDEAFKFPKPKKLTRSEIKRFVGTYYAKNKKFAITEESSKLFIEYKNQPKRELIIVDENLLMYRDGQGDGSRMANILLNKVSDKITIELLLRKEKTSWIKK